MKKTILTLISIVFLFSSFQKIRKRNIASGTLPITIVQLIKQYSAEATANPPRKIYSYVYNGQMVYYVTAPCCDFFSDLYDSKGMLIAHPDGGFTGKGDGKLPDFNEKKKNQKLVWADKRK